jgi:hypothetical protein
MHLENYLYAKEDVSVSPTAYKPHLPSGRSDGGIYDMYLIMCTLHYINRLSELYETTRFTSN